MINLLLMEKYIPVIDEKMGFCKFYKTESVSLKEGKTLLKHGYEIIVFTFIVKNINKRFAC